MIPKKRPRPLVICGPSGSGKSTIIKMLFNEFPNTFGFSVSHTTRHPRPGEENGIHYNFVSHEQMKNAIEAGEFIESATFGSNIYGTSRKAVENVLEEGKVCVLDIDVQGVEQIKKTDLDPILIFNNPPSVEILKTRLINRNTETEESLQQRLDAAKQEIEYGHVPGNFHIIINNTDLDEAYKELKEFVLKELQNQKASGINVVI